MDKKQTAWARAYALNRSMNADSINKAVRRDHVTYDNSGTVRILHSRRTTNASSNTQKNTKTGIKT